MRIGFLFNHDQLHQVAHSLPIALALAEQGDLEVVIISTSPLLTREIYRLAGPKLARSLTLVQLKLRRFGSRLLSRLLDRLVPAHKILIYRDNLDFFRSLDVLVVSEKTSLLLKTRYGLRKLKIIHTRHGAGDRAIGFNRSSALFDHVLVAGLKIKERLISEAGVSGDRISIVGYPKFDLPAGSCFQPAPDGRPTVLYNPHVSPHLSSWFAAGREILDWFAEHDEYRLIFAPHIMLFERRMILSLDRIRVESAGMLKRSHLSCENIHVDLGSRALTTMAYLNCSDIYLGDVSSQVYEFLAIPRPCVFLNMHSVKDWQSNQNYMHWQAGPVIEEARYLGSALKSAVADHKVHYASVQRELFRYTFDLDPAKRSADRAAEVVRSVSLGEISSTLVSNPALA